MGPTCVKEPSPSRFLQVVIGHVTRQGSPRDFFSVETRKKRRLVRIRCDAEMILLTSQPYALLDRNTGLWPT